MADDDHADRASMWVTTEALFDVLPGPRAAKRRLVLQRVGGTALPETLPYRLAVALGATMEAQARGGRASTALFDLVALHRPPLDELLLIRTGLKGSWRVVRAEAFTPGPYIVIELQEIGRLVASCSGEST